MKDEIIDNIKADLLYCYEDSYSTKEEYEKELDYITNLQEDYEKEHYLVDKLTRQLTDEYKNTEYQCKQKERLQKENKKLQKEVEKLQRENNVLRSLVPNNEEYYFSVR